ncbi:hypothetical protein [Pukyongiella litopenaei]|uniref:Flagellar FliJ protein n=1 Tax=Pukyongiella litopenaei TaxID=2605946 RepID=A0A2S0MSH1_9RHOB|nr:hypothetical protein [Pukyongiella litopenaei]AVO38848.1 hypothetical protein C6Y53_14850 [Pukyongiella litopenaei]
MKATDLDGLAGAADLMYQRELRVIREVLAREAEIRNDLARLDRMQQSNRDGGDDHRQLRAIGADMLWQEWLANTRTELQRSLSEARARKLRVMAGARRAFGRKQAVDMIAAEIARERRVLAIKKVGETLQQQMLYRPR